MYHEWEDELNAIARIVDIEEVEVEVDIEEVEVEVEVEMQIPYRYGLLPGTTGPVLKCTTCARRISKDLPTNLRDVVREAKEHEQLNHSRRTT